MSASFSAAISEHPVPAAAMGEVAGHLLETIGEGPDLLCVFVTAAYAGALEDIAPALHTLIDPKVLIGCAASGVIGPRTEVEGRPAISVWAGNVGRVEPVRLQVVDIPSGSHARAISGWPIDLDWVPAGAVLLADPFSFPITTLFGTLNRAGGFPRVVGGMASAGVGPGGNRLVLNDTVYEDGAVGVLIDANVDHPMQTAVAQGCRPIGIPLVATRADGNRIYELDGVSAIKRLSELLRNQLSPEDVELAADGLLVGLNVGGERFIVRTLLDADPETGSLAIGEKVDAGAIVQFHLRDAETADIEMRDVFDGARAGGSLLFASEGRGEQLFDESNHDVDIVADLLADAPTAGFFTAGEFAPLFGQNRVQGFTTAAGLFG